MTWTSAIIITTVEPSDDMVITSLRTFHTRLKCLSHSLRFNYIETPTLLTKYNLGFNALSVDPSPVLRQLIRQCSCRFVTELCGVYMTVLADAETDQVDSASEATSDRK